MLVFQAIGYTVLFIIKYMTLFPWSHSSFKNRKIRAVEESLSITFSSLAKEDRCLIDLNFFA